MDDSLLVRGFQRVGDLRRDLQHFLGSTPDDRRSASVGPSTGSMTIAWSSNS